MEKPSTYIFEKDRLDSFKGKWKILRGFKHCTPAKFAAAGFHYAGTASMPDNVKCFACQKELGDWEKDDDPWEEHKKRGQNCKFVQLKTKSETTVRDLIELYIEIKTNEVINLFDERKDVLKKDQEAFKKTFSKLKRKQ